jgi:hypothetical protein
MKALNHLRHLASGLAVTLLIGSALGYATDAHAEGLVVGLHLASHHFPDDEGYNNVNVGAYARFDNGLTIGGYRNSIRRNSFYAGYTQALPGPFSVTVGAISGYKLKQGKGHKVGSTSEGHTRGALGLLLAPSIALPSIMGVTPRIIYSPGHLVKADDSFNLSIESSF